MSDNDQWRRLVLDASHGKTPGTVIGYGVRGYPVTVPADPANSAARDWYRDASDWRVVVQTFSRCGHGRTQGDACFECPEGFSPDRSGTLVGEGPGGRVVVPARENARDPHAWRG
jgi:hypothetical protein